MANIVITSTTNSIKIVWNTTAVKYAKECWHKHSAHFYLNKDSLFVEALEDNGTGVSFTYDGVGGMQVDSVDGVSPTSNSDLYDKLIALIA